MKHTWKRTKSGVIDEWAYDGSSINDDESFCNGPVCTVCWRSECMHCCDQRGVDIYALDDCPGVDE